MQTKVVVVDENHIDAAVMKEAGHVIRQGGLVAFPTETVYGLGGDALNKESSSKIYLAKGRPSDNPLIIHITNMNALEKIVQEIPEAAYKLADAFWPGPLTMIFKKNDLVPKETTGGLDTVAVRMPSHKIAIEFIHAAGGYVAAPSANTSGKPSPTLAKYVVEDMSGKIDMILDGGSIGIGLESTIVDLTDVVPIILRPGSITQEMLEAVLDKVEMDPGIMSGDINNKPKAPGMKYKHYAPKGNLTIIDGEIQKVTQFINDAVKKNQTHLEKVGVIATDETVEIYHADSVKSVGKRMDEESIARRLYQILREFDEEEVTIIYSEAFSSIGMGQAIMNRLLKAAGYQVIQL